MATPVTDQMSHGTLPFSRGVFMLLFITSKRELMMAVASPDRFFVSRWRMVARNPRFTADDVYAACLTLADEWLSWRAFKLVVVKCGHCPSDANV